MDLLRRGLAPITDEAWDQIETTAKRTLQACLSARRVVDVEGPKGWDYAAVNLGRLEKTHQEPNEVGYGIRAVLPLVECRMMFSLDCWEMDNASRGAGAVELGPLEEAARKIAMFEETAIYKGFGPGGIQGLKGSAGHEALKFSGEPGNLLETVAQGLTEFTHAAVEGPYVLLAGSKLWQAISEHNQCYPLRTQLERLLGSALILNPFVEESFLISLRGGDMKLTLGQDFTVGYHSHTAEKVELYLTESFTFQVLDGAAIIPVIWQNK
jgi:uncharacterized linocin/CFP29 family protein